MKIKKMILCAMVVMMQTAQPVAQSDIPFYTAACAIGGGALSAGGCYYICSSCNCDAQTCLNRSLVAGMVGCTASGVIAYVVLSQRTPEARLEKAGKILTLMESDAFLSQRGSDRRQVLKNVDQYFGYSETSLSKAAEFINETVQRIYALTLSLNAAQKDCTDRNTQQECSQLKTRIRMLLSNVISLKNIISNQPDYKVQRAWRLVQEAEKRARR